VAAAMAAACDNCVAAGICTKPDAVCAVCPVLAPKYGDPYGVIYDVAGTLLLIVSIYNFKFSFFLSNPK
jgi:hypothetical protein